MSRNRKIQVLFFLTLTCSWNISLFVPQTQTDCLSSCKRPKTQTTSLFCHVLLGSKEVPLVKNVQLKKRKKNQQKFKNQILQNQKKKKRDKSETNHHIAFLKDSDRIGELFHSRWNKWCIETLQSDFISDVVETYPCLRLKSERPVDTEEPLTSRRI